MTKEATGKRNYRFNTGNIKNKPSIFSAQIFHSYTSAKIRDIRVLY